MRSYYFEVQIDKIGDGDITIGLSCNPNSNHHPGTEFGSVGLRAYYGRIDHSTGKEDAKGIYGWIEIKNYDTLGCMIRREYIEGALYVFCYFTKNGERLNPVVIMAENDYYPAIAVDTADAVFTPNLGEKPFLYDTSGMRISNIIYELCVRLFTCYTKNFKLPTICSSFIRSPHR